MISIHTIMTNSTHKTDGGADRLAQQLQSVQYRERELKQQRKILLHEQAQLDRKKRNRRIFTRGGMLEAFMRKPLLLTDDQVYRLLRAAFSTREVREAEAALIAEAEREAAEGEGGAGDDGALGLTASR